MLKPQQFDSKLEKEIFDKSNESEIDLKQIIERRSKIQVNQSKQLEFEEKKRKKIEAEAKKNRKEAERVRKKRLKNENNVKNLVEKEVNESSESEESDENQYSYYLFYNGEEESEDESELNDVEKKKNIIVSKKRKSNKKSKKSVEVELFDSLLKTRKEFSEENFEAEEEYNDEDEKKKEEKEEAGEREEGEENEDLDYYSLITHSTFSTISVLSAITFEWEDNVYEFEELVDPGTIDNIYQRHSIKLEYHDGIGKIRYLALCKNLSIVPISRFVEALESSEIDLSWQSFDRDSIRAICAALEINTYVKKLVLSCNKLSPEDCHYLGQMLKYNDTIEELDLSGCRIGPEGIKRLVEFLPQNQTLRVLNLSKCNIEDEGMVTLSQALNGNNSIQVLDLSYNKLGEESAAVLATIIQFNFSINDLNLRYNYFFSPDALKELFLALTSNEYITNLNLSWNGMSGKNIGTYIGNYLKKNQAIEELDLSDNRFQGPSIKEIKKGLAKSATLKILKFGKNPASTEDLEILLSGAKTCSTLNLLDLENLWVEKSFVKTLEKIQATRNFEAIFEGVNGNYVIKGPDYAALILKRAQFEAKKPKRKKLRKDFGHFIWTMGNEPLTTNEFMDKVKKFKAKINKDLFPELVEQFLIPNKNLIDVLALKAKYLKIFPNSTPPPPKKIKIKGKTGKKTKELKQSIDSKVKKISLPKVTFYGDDKKSKISQVLKISKTVIKKEEKVEPEEEIEGEGGVILVIEPWISSEDESELFNYESEEGSENEESLIEFEGENEDGSLEDIEKEKIEFYKKKSKLSDSIKKHDFSDFIRDTKMIKKNEDEMVF